MEAIPNSLPQQRLKAQRKLLWHDLSLGLEMNLESQISNSCHVGLAVIDKVSFSKLENFPGVFTARKSKMKNTKSTSQNTGSSSNLL